MTTGLPTRLALAVLAPALIAAAARGQTAPDSLAKLKASYEAAAIRIQQEYSDSKERCEKGYPAALQTKEILFRRAGNLDGVLAVRKEKERYEEEKSVPKDPPAGTDDQVKVLQEAYHKALDDAGLKHNRSIVELTSLYCEKLKDLEMDLTRAGRIDEALAAREEQERVRRDPVVTAAEFAMADVKASAAAADQPPAVPPAAQPRPPPAAASKCNDCAGSGKCDRCKGSGSSPHGFRGIRTTAKCIRCMGSGKCRTCDGTGRVDADNGPPPAPTVNTPAQDTAQPGLPEFLEGVAQLLRSAAPREIDMNEAWLHQDKYANKLLKSTVHVRVGNNRQAYVFAGKTMGEGRSKPVWYPLTIPSQQVADKVRAVRRGSKVTVTYIFTQKGDRYLLDVVPIDGDGGNRREPK